MRFKASVNWVNFTISLSSFEASSFRCCRYSSNSITLLSSEAKIEILYLDLMPLSEVVSTITYWGQLVSFGIVDSFLIRFASVRGTNLPFFDICFSVPPNNRLLCSSFPHFPDRMLATSANQFVQAKHIMKSVKSNKRIELTWILRFTQGNESRFHQLTFKSSTSWSSGLATNSPHKVLLHDLCKKIAAHCRVVDKDVVE